MQRVYGHLILPAALLILQGCRPQPSPTVFVDPTLATLVPPDTVMLAGVRMEQLAQTPFWKNYIQTGKVALVDDFRKRTGLDPAKDLWEILMTFDGRNAVVLVRGKFSDMGMEPRLEKEGAERFSYKGVTLIGDKTNAVAFLNPSTAAAGNVSVLQRLIDNRNNVTGLPANLESRIKKIPSTNQAWFAAQVSGVVPGLSEGQPGMMTNLARLVQSVQFATGAADFRQQLNTTVDLETTDAQAADRVSGALRGLLGIGRLNTREDQREVLSVYDGMHVTKQNSIVRFSTDIPYSVLDRASSELPFFRSR